MMGCDDLAPFWAISGEELRRRAIQVSFHVVVDGEYCLEFCIQRSRFSLTLI